MVSTKMFVAAMITLSFLEAASAGNFLEDFGVGYGDWRAKILENGQILYLSLDRASGSAVVSKSLYLFARADMKIKLVHGNSAGTVTTFYMIMKGMIHHEIDFEFLGDVSGKLYTLQTNIYVYGHGNKEQRFHLWFDPTLDFHTYTILWNSQNIIFYVEEIPIRQFKNFESRGVPYPKDQQMQIQCSLWEASDWATRGGRIKIDWSLAPFTASYRNCNVQACTWSRSSSCSNPPSRKSWLTETPGRVGQTKLNWACQKFMIYDYCTDIKRFPEGLPHECKLA
ncbi:xyloglucan endotransglucosylase protein 7-like isoform X2 [Rhododendron vialii]|uniref:xyloglucan endotransglucosylase protein 7-like isoform X2 n=1 Tax=Rhododendron vialii TaxID=182163 RepID=UPI00265F6BD7|nr:xyloglucan endotransglucosylase protein 7-like isoform X2 [Rhododendron vialii]